jgi:hypothetical protein
MDTIVRPQFTAANVADLETAGFKATTESTAVRSISLGCRTGWQTVTVTAKGFVVSTSGGGSPKVESRSVRMDRIIEKANRMESLEQFRHGVIMYGSL